MTLNEFNSLIAPLLNLFFTALSSISIVLLLYQIRQTNKWNQAQSKYNFIDVAEASRLHAALDEIFDELKMTSTAELGTGISDEVIAKSKTDRRITIAFNTFLNDMQNTCAAYRYGLVDKAVFERVHAGRIRWWHGVFMPYVLAKRTDYRDPYLWADFEEVGGSFSQPTPGAA